MQLKLQRSQRTGGLLGGTVIFCLDARADYSPPEAANISKYKLGGQVVYSSQAARRHLENVHHQLDRVDSELLREKTAGIGRSLVSLAMAKMSLNVSIASLGHGHHIECKDLPELLEAERALMEACRNVKQFLEAAATFNGSVVLVDFDDGEKVHLSQGVLELAALPAPAPPVATPSVASEAAPEVGTGFYAFCRTHSKPIALAVSVLGALAVEWFFGLTFYSGAAAVLMVFGGLLWAMK